MFISEYVEGSSNNKAIELYNPSEMAVDLGAENYTLVFYFNGETTPRAIALTGTVAPKGTFVIADKDSAVAIRAVANQLSANAFFNGDDAVVLKKGSSVVDAIGQIGVDPGEEWGSGNIATKDKTLRRIATVLTGDAIATDPFNPALEWEGYPLNTFSGLGSHTTRDETPPNLHQGSPLTPVDDSTDVAIDTVLTLQFNEAIQRGVGTLVLKRTIDGLVVESFDIETSNLVSITGNSLIVDPSNDLEFATEYHIELEAGAVKDLAGNSFGGFSNATTWNFVTVAAPPSENEDPTPSTPPDPDPEPGEPTDPSPSVPIDPAPTEPEPNPSPNEPTEPNPTEPGSTDPNPSPSDPIEPDPNPGEPTEPEPVEPEPTEPDSPEPNPASDEPIAPEPNPGEPTEPGSMDPPHEPTEPEPTEPNPDPNSGEPTAPDSSDPEPTAPDLGEPDSSNPEPIDSEPINPEPINPEPPGPNPPDLDSPHSPPTDSDPTSPEPTGSEQPGGSNPERPSNSAPDSEDPLIPISDSESDQGSRLGSARRDIPFSRINPGAVRAGDAEGDLLRGTPGSDVLRGGAENDRLFGGVKRNGHGKDHLIGNGGDDWLWGGKGKDRLDGGHGNDVLLGGKNRDLCLGGNGGDRLIGQGGNDILVGGHGNDRLKGGRGRDMFAYTSVKDGTDTILQFDVEQDLIDLRQIFARSAFSGASPSMRLNAYIDWVQVGAGTEVRIDADGNGEEQQFITLALLKGIDASEVTSRNYVIT